MKGAETEVLQPLPRMVRRAKLARLLMAGVTTSRAAELLGLSAEQVRRECRDPQFRRDVYARLETSLEGVDSALEEDNLTLHEQIKVAGQEAFDTLLDIMRSETSNEAVRARIAQDLLDRNPDTGKEVTIRHEVLPPKALQAAAKAAQEMDTVLRLVPKKEEEKSA